MFNTAINLNAYPANVKKAIVCLTMGWVVHLVCYYNNFTGEVLGRSDYLMFAVGIAICFFVASINTWARTLSLFFNIAIIVLYGLYVALILSSQARLPVLPILAILLFVLATYYLLRKDTAEFFRSFNAAEAQGDEKKE